MSRRHEFDLRSVRVGFVMNKVALSWVSCKYSYLCLPLSVSFHQSSMAIPSPITDAVQAQYYQLTAPIIKALIAKMARILSVFCLQISLVSACSVKV